MAGFKDIVGHEQIIEHLKTAIEMGKGITRIYTKRTRSFR